VSAVTHVVESEERGEGKGRKGKEGRGRRGSVGLDFLRDAHAPGSGLTCVERIISVYDGSEAC
jgi:hypothetical protein